MAFVCLSVRNIFVSAPYLVNHLKGNLEALDASIPFKSYKLLVYVLCFARQFELRNKNVVTNPLKPSEFWSNVHLSEKKNKAVKYHHREPIK